MGSDTFETFIFSKKMFAGVNTDNTKNYTTNLTNRFSLI